jgi:DNA-binding LacI/PurR family transcriptional regulator
LTGRRPAGGDDATAAQLAALSDAQDVDLETLAVYRTRHQDGEIPLIAWPPTDRRFARGVIVVPCRPLDDADVHPSPELISETWRRHTPLVVLGACPTSAKTYTVVPDFQDAGFQITNHLYHAGCQRIVVLVSDDAGRACRRALGGCQSAALRLGRPLSSVEVLRTDEVEPANGNGSGGAIPSSSDRMTGIWSFGSRAFDAMKRLLDRPMPTDAPGAVAFACLLEPGDERAAHANVTSYETSVESMAMWAIRLIHEAQPGQPPSEVLIPGDLCVRDRAGRDATLSGTNAAVAPRRMDPAIVC